MRWMGESERERERERERRENLRNKFDFHHRHRISVNFRTRPNEFLAAREICPKYGTMDSGMGKGEGV